MQACEGLAWQAAYSFADKTYMESENLGPSPSSNTEQPGDPRRH